MGALTRIASGTMTHRDVALVGGMLGAAIAILGTLGALDSFVTPLPIFDLDREVGALALIYGESGFNLFAAFSAGVLLCASVAALALRRTDAGSAGAKGLWGLLAGLFAFMSLDELFALHEYVEIWMDTDWQLLYLPLILAAGYVWVRALQLILARNRTVGLAWIGGAACWLSAQLLEALFWNTSLQHRAVEGWLVIGEEILEVSGSSLFLVAMLLLLGDPGGDRSRIESPAGR